ncbi:hypothetical protein GQ42DRAFT_49559 [Ramicandelaber brevisporus]|nr:hypothetical protein GQ42DRAFT_49559 [Ramicandelaber brevisporus]
MSLAPPNHHTLEPDQDHEPTEAARPPPPSGHCHNLALTTNQTSTTPCGTILRITTAGCAMSPTASPRMGHDRCFISPLHASNRVD